MAAPDDPREAVLQAESAVSSAIFSTAAPTSGSEVRVGSAAEAILAAAAAAAEGKRAAAVLSPGELLGALAAIHAAARARAAVIVHVVGEANGVVDGGPPQTSGRDEIAPALDAGAGVLVTWSAQETVDLALAARRAAEDAETPFVLVTDGGGPVTAFPTAELVAAFLGAGRDGGSRPQTPGHDGGSRPQTPGHDGGSRPQTPGRSPGSAPAVHHVQSKRVERSYAARAPFALAGAMRELGDLTGRALGPVERFETTDADEIVVAVGQAYSAARAAAAGLRREGRRVGAVGVRALRPFFPGELVKAVSRARAVAVIEPLDVALAPAGPLATCLKAAFADAITWAPGFPGVGHIPPIVSVVFATITGAITEREVREALGELHAGDRAKRLVVFGSDAPG